MFPKMVVPQNGWFTWKTLFEIDDLGGKTHHFRKHQYVGIYIYIYLGYSPKGTQLFPLVIGVGE